ncbi:MAG: hypothetical protein AB7S26_08755 [Sandaracinaceae bacterium]
MLFFAVEGAPPEVCRTATAPDGSLTFHTTVQGCVLAVEAGAFVIAHGSHRIRVHHLLPEAIDLGALLHHAVRLEIAQCYRGAGRATIDAELRDAHGRFLLWARDGKMPPDSEAHGLALRTVLDRGAVQLVIRHEGPRATLRAPGCREVVREGERSVALLGRLAIDDVSLVVVRK